LRPIYFTIKNETTHFHYKFSELKNFVKQGKKTGDVGMLLVRRQGNMLTYKGFGTIENPFTYIMTLSIIHSPILDGKMVTDEQRLAKFVN